MNQICAEINYVPKELFYQGMNLPFVRLSLSAFTFQVISNQFQYKIDTEDFFSGDLPQEIFHRKIS